MAQDWWWVSWIGPFYPRAGCYGSKLSIPMPQLLARQMAWHAHRKTCRIELHASSGPVGWLLEDGMIGMGFLKHQFIYPINQVSHEIGVSQSWGTNHHNIRPKMTGLLANWVLMKKTLKTSWKGRQVAGACRKCRVLSGAVETWWSCCPDWCRIYRLDDVGLWNRRFHRKTAKNRIFVDWWYFFMGF